ncbi:MAG: peptidylprolyl isomerase [Ignavibacteriaceae bacterium]|nr:peptidylprolyl isomerase [Ignavibacteriaceae bacterium]
MGMMARMRGLAPAFIITVGALFVLFMVISDSNVLEALGGRTNNVGSVNGEDISYQEFVNAVDQQRENQKKQTGKDVDEESLDQMRDQVWDALVSQKLLAEQIEKFGISVSDDEIKEIILGDNPPEFLKQNFIDSTGNFNRQVYEQALFDTRNKEALLQAEEFVRQNRLNEKLQSLILASVNISEADIRNRFNEQNQKIKAEYLLVDLSIYPDSTVKFDDNDLKKYYNENLDKYKNQAQRKLQYVLFSNNPSADDSATVRQTLETVAEKFKKDTVNFQTYVEIYSTVPYTKDTLALNVLPTGLQSIINKTAAGSVVGPIAAPEGFVLYRYVGTVPTKETLVKASHILINNMGSEEKNRDEANKIYNQLSAGANFEEIAKLRSGDPGSGSKGGDLGWFGKGAMVPEFEKAVFGGPVGVVQKPVKTNYGYHIIKVTGKSNNKYILEKIVNPVQTSATTIDANFNSAQDFAYVAAKNGFEKEAKLMNYVIQESSPFVKEAYSIPGIGVNNNLRDFAFENSLNTVSEVHKVSTGYVVCKISEVINEGAKPFDEVKNSVQAAVIREKKYDMAKSYAIKLKSQLNGDLFKARNLNPKLVVDTTGQFTPNGSIPKIGRDYAFTYAAVKADLNKVTDPVRGFRGQYLIKVSERNQFDSTAYSLQRTSIRDQLYQEKRSMYVNQWLDKLKKDADIEDKRYMFFGR